MAIFYGISFVFLFICPVFVISSYMMFGYEENTYIKPETIEVIKHDTPSYIDLLVYIPLLKRVIDFCEKNNTILSVNLVHGLFLTSVHLGPFVTDNDIPDILRTEIENLLKRADSLQTGFNSATNSKFIKTIASLASNATSWSKRVPKLNFDLLKKTYARGEYPQWDKYQSTVDATEKGIPNPTLSDQCMGALVKNQENQENLSEDKNWRCDLPNECYKSIINGTDFGYWLVHRLIMLLHARLGRDCAIFSAHEDHLYRINFCEKAFREVEYIASNGFQMADLPLEQIGFCALDGNAQFLRRSWLLSFLEFQQPSGCFQLYKLKSTDKPNMQNCNDHAMAVALATYAAAVRFILENLKKLIQ